MDIIFLLILGIIGVAGLIKGKISVSKNKALMGSNARILSAIFIIAGAQLVIKDYLVSNSPGANDSAAGYLLGTIIVVAVATILFMIFGSENIGPIA